MKASKKTYKLSKWFPPYTIEQWLDTYKGFIETYYLTPKNRRKGEMWNDFMNEVNIVKNFLKEHNVKFI